MSRVLILEERCKGCLLCTEACPRGLLQASAHFNKQGYRVVAMVENGEPKCTGCAFCATMCPDVAIRVYRTKEARA